MRRGLVLEFLHITLTLPIPGKEIILRRYLNSQTPESDPFADRGFLRMAMAHLEQEQHLQQQHQEHHHGRRDTGANGSYTGGESDPEREDGGEEDFFSDSEAISPLRRRHHR